MRRILVPSFAVLAVTLATSFSSAMWDVSNTGDWPKTWPAQLESLRPISRTLGHSSYTMYHIPFTDRAKFEAAWPHLLLIADQGSPLTLSRGHNISTAVDFDAGVVIFAPNTGHLAHSSIPGRKLLTVGPPWPDDIKDQSGNPSEYVIHDGLKWRPITVQTMQDDLLSRIRSQRARTEIQLIVDGKIVDLNRITLPASVVDRRFGRETSR